MIETTAKTRLLGILGMPVEHTLSPQMHSFMANLSGMDTAYLAFPVEPEDLGAAVTSLRKINALGFNITSPHKIAVMDHIQHIDPAAELMGTVNTIVNRGGQWYGYNTDGDGFVHSLIYEGIEVKGKDILLIGAGGSARSVAYSFACSGARSITVSGRTPEKVEAILNVLRENTKTEVSNDMDSHSSYDIIVNTTPLGMHPYEDQNPFDRFDLLKQGGAACDLIYNPKKTVFLKEAEKYGAKLVNGLNMLILQGIYAYRLYTDAKLETESVYHELKKLFNDFRLD